jgi:uncharacterized protein YukE
MSDYDDWSQALEGFTDSLENVNADLDAIADILRWRLHHIEQRMNADIIEDMADTLKQDADYRHNIAAQIVATMKPAELADYRALNLDEKEPQS